MVVCLYMPKSGIVGSYGSSVFSFLRDFHTVLHSNCLHPHQQYRRVPFSLHPLQHILFVNFLTLVILAAVMRYFSFDFHFSSNLQHRASLCRFGPSMYLWRNFYLDLLIFSLGCLVFFWYWTLWIICIFWRLITCQLYHLQVFSPIL